MEAGERVRESDGGKRGRVYHCVLKFVYMEYMKCAHFE